MTQRFSFPKLVVAVFALALALVGASSLIATEAEVAVQPTVDVAATLTAELAADQVTFPITPWFAESADFLPGPLNISCCYGSSCTADWQCGGPGRGYCKIGACVCL